MAALAVVENFDVFEDSMAGSNTALEDDLLEQLTFQGAEKALYNSIVPAIPLTTHAAPGPQAGQSARKGLLAYWVDSIAVVQ